MYYIMYLGNYFNGFRGTSIRDPQIDWSSNHILLLDRGQVREAIKDLPPDIEIFELNRPNQLEPLDFK